MEVLWGIGGMVALVALALLLSTNRRAVRWRTVLAALGIQVAFGVLVLFWPAGQAGTLANLMSATIAGILIG